jgi:hypothetical protein
MVIASGIKKRIAVIGASGIGKHHANWWSLEGADVCAIVGSSDTTAAATADAVRSQFGVEATPYASVSHMVGKEAPDIVDVCSPHALHLEHVGVSLDAGCDVLCEKPFAYDPDIPTHALLENTATLVERAGAAGRTLGISTQYVQGAKSVSRLWQTRQDSQAVERIGGHLAAPNRGREPNPVRVWVDMAPHPLSVIQCFAPNGALDWDSVKTDFSAYEARATFEVKCENGSSLCCTVIAANTTEEPGHVRRIQLNDTVFDIGGQRDADGVYNAAITTGGDTLSEPDFMRMLIRAFLAGKPMADGEFGLTNLRWLLGLLDKARCG